MATNTTPGVGGVPLTPDYANQFDQALLANSWNAASQPYQPYTQPRIAGFTADQQNAQAMAQNVASGTISDPAASRNAIAYGMSGYDPNEVNKYMSPYTSGVVNEIQRLGVNNLMTNELPKVNSTFAGAGQFGSSRNGQFVNQAMQDQNYNILGRQSEALNTAFNNANANYNQWHQNAIPNAQAAANLETGGLNVLNQAGQQQQDQTQKSLDLAYGDFKNQQDYAKNQLGWFNDVQKGIAPASGSAQLSYDNTTAPSPWVQGLNAASQIYGMFK